MNLVDVFLQTPPILLYVFATLGTAFTYLSTAGLAFLYVQRLKAKSSPLLLNKQPFKKEFLRKEFQWSMVSLLVFGFNALIIQWIVLKGFAQFSQTPTSFANISLELIVFLIWNEVHFFAVHRLFHAPLLFRFHKIHHAQANISPLSIFCFHPLEAAALGSVIPLLLPFYNFHIESIFLFVFASMLLNTWGHSGLDLFNGSRFPDSLRASQRHFAHHKFHKVNFGFFFRIFDKIGRTGKEDLIKNSTLLVCFFLSSLFLDTAQAKAAAYRKRIIELDRYYHVQNFTITYAPFTDLEIRNLLEDTVKAQISCDADVLFIAGKKQIKAASYSGAIYSPINAQKLFVRMTQENAHCVLKTMGYEITLTPERELHPEVAQLRQEKDLCKSQNTSPLILSCHSQAEDVEILRDPYKALNARFKILMGYDLGLSAYIKKDPDMYLDFSRAPKLDLIVFDTLQVMKDFVGTLHMRILEHHLRQGTKVYITTSKALLLPHETGWIYELKRRFPQIHFNLYEKTPDGFNLKEGFHSLHRNSHVKVLLAYSQAHPENNALVAGGRNASEMYFYPEQPDNSAYPQITQWGEAPLYGWVYFNDLDFKVSGTAATQAVARSLMSYNEGLPWNTSQNFPSLGSTAQSNFSFFVSSPFDEGQGQLEKIYVDLFQQAKKSVHIISPYINFTKKIAQALAEAQQRGVDIHITTNLSVEGDFMPGILQPAMNKSIRQVIKKYKIRYFSVDKQIYHTKAIIVDEQAILLGSINMNQRSFLHDTEIAFLFNDTNVVRQFNEDFSRAIAPHLNELTPEQIPRASLMELIVSPFMSVF